MAKVAFLGLGVMGGPMAAHLQNKGGHHVTVYNRTRAKAEAWVAKHGGRLAPTPAEAAGGQDFVFACVGNDDDLREVAVGPEGALPAMERGAIFIDHTTASAAVARELAESAAERGVGFLDAPVSGGQAGAENGVLTVMVGGDEIDFERAKPVISAYSRMIGLMGPVGSGQLTKMVNQICIAGLVQGLAEGIHFGSRAGLDVDKVVEVISKGAAGSWQMDNRHKTMICRQIRLRLCRRLDAQGPRHLPRRSRPQWRQLADHRARRPVLQGGPGDRRKALGHLLPACRLERSYAASGGRSLERRRTPCRGLI